MCVQEGQQEERGELSPECGAGKLRGRGGFDLRNVWSVVQGNGR